MMMMMMMPTLSISPFLLYCSILPITMLTTNLPDSAATNCEQFRTIHSHISNRSQPATRIPPQPATPKLQHTTETRTHDQCGDTIEKSQAPDDGCINVRNMLSIEEVK